MHPHNTRICPHCSNPLHPSKISTAIYCSAKCRCDAANQRSYPKSRPSTLSPGTIGAWGEIMVSADLMRRGYHVFRALSPSCPCDLLIYRNGGDSIRIEVRTIGTKPDGTPRLYQDPRDGEKHDIYAFVTHDGQITYLPDLP